MTNLPNTDLNAMPIKPFLSFTEREKEDEGVRFKSSIVMKIRHDGRNGGSEVKQSEYKWIDVTC